MSDARALERIRNDACTPGDPCTPKVPCWRHLIPQMSPRQIDDILTKAFPPRRGQ